MPTLSRSSDLPWPADHVFRWHTRPGAMERLVPPWESVRVLERTGGIADGGRLRIAVRRGPFHFHWELRHTDFEEGRLFRDEQVRGPFTTWVHSHRFIPIGDDRCRVEDEVEWTVPGGAAVDSLVSCTLVRLFDFRHRRLRNDLELHSRFPDRPPLRVAMTGSSGLIGRNLSHFLTSGGHTVIPLVRSREKAARLSRAPRQGSGAIYWSVERGEIEREKLEGLSAVAHLAGEPLIALRWTEGKKRAIRESRVHGTRLLAGALASLQAPPEALLVASGIDYYGNRGSEVVTEESASGSGFLAEVCRAWEAAAEPAREAGLRVTNLRSGMVLSPEGGALATMLLPFRMGAGGRIGRGNQYMSWIDIDDETGLIHHALMNDAVDGPLNGTAPAPVPNADFTDTLGRVLRRPTLVPLPSAAVRALMGEMGETLLLQGRRAYPAKAERTGYSFLFGELEESLRHNLGRPAAASAPRSPGS